jgi:hypothetical protein
MPPQLDSTAQDGDHHKVGLGAFKGCTGMTSVVRLAVYEHPARDQSPQRRLSEPGIRDILGQLGVHYLHVGLDPFDRREVLALHVLGDGEPTRLGIEETPRATTRRSAIAALAA